MVAVLALVMIIKLEIVMDLSYNQEVNKCSYPELLRN